LVRSDAFEAAAAAKISETHPQADLLALRASFNLVRLSTLHMHKLESEVHRDAGWSMAGFRVMFCVWVAGDLEPREIARFSGLSRAAVSSVLNTLERDGLVERHRESSDRRLVTVRLTETGETRLVAAYGKENDVERGFFAPLGRTELDTFVVLLRRLLRQPSLEHQD
jgi:DNA-binding MarR family transcriptional regulator